MVIRVKWHLPGGTHLDGYDLMQHPHHRDQTAPWLSSIPVMIQTAQCASSWTRVSRTWEELVQFDEDNSMLDARCRGFVLFRVTPHASSSVSFHVTLTSRNLPPNTGLSKSFWDHWRAGFWSLRNFHGSGELEASIFWFISFHSLQVSWKLVALNLECVVFFNSLSVPFKNVVSTSYWWTLKFFLLVTARKVLNEVKQTTAPKIFSLCVC